MPTERVVIVGGGHAGVQAAVTLRQQGFSGSVTLITEEERGPYQRPPLSKALLTGRTDLDRIQLRPPSLYEKLEIEVRTGSGATSIDRIGRRIECADGVDLEYDRLLLATGSRVRRLPVPADTHNRIHYLRSADDALRLREGLAAGSRVVIVGGGYLGLEVASVAIRAVANVTVLEAAESLLARVSGPEIAEHLTLAHRAQGVDVRTGSSVREFAINGRGIAVTCSDGAVHEADLVLIAVGIVPNVDLAEKAGLECSDGILVDESSRTSDERIFAAGDCTNHPNPIFQTRLRLESVHNAMEQGKIAAAGMRGDPRRYEDVPRFWSDQYGIKLQTVGVARGHDDRVAVTRDDGGLAAVFYLRQGILVAVDAINCPSVLAAGARLIQERRRVDGNEIAAMLGSDSRVAA